ncbi:MAG: hypothetical protein L0H84_14790, partial [Pseudonocardia sp.]|nr:hypothetical protein [Pseudonocardia sp.]
APAPPRPAQPVDRPTPQPGPVVPPVDEEPLPPEPPDDDEPPDDRYAGDPTADPAVPDDGPQPERDGPEEVALRLLSSTFGAQRLDPSQQLTPPSGG